MTAAPRVYCPSCSEPVVAEPTEWEDAVYNANAPVPPFGAGDEDDQQKWFRLNTLKCPECGACGSEDDFSELVDVP